MTSRPSASVLTTSTVLPPWIVSTSPSRVAVPDGMLSVHISQPVTFVRQPRSRSVVIAPRIAADPDMSSFIAACIASDGLRLIPPESYMIPLPTRPRWPEGRFAAGVYVSLIIRAGSALPALTPRRPPQPSVGELPLVEDLDFEARLRRRGPGRPPHSGAP